ncbi:hypothetical protein [Mycolicibacterium phlei]
MQLDRDPFIGTEALAAGALTRHELRRFYRPLAPDVYLAKRVTPSLRQRTVGAYLWTGRGGVVAGQTAAALHGVKWIDDSAPVELIWGNARAPRGVRTRKETLLAPEVQTVDGLAVTTPARTAFDLGRRAELGEAVALLDGLAAATGVPAEAVLDVAAAHRHTRGLRQLERAVALMDAGAQSPKETWLRMLLINNGFPRPQTQIPVLSPDGFRRYYLDMGWAELMLAVEYDGDWHRSPEAYAYGLRRAEDIAQLGWTRVVASKRTSANEIVSRVLRAWVFCTSRAG